MADPPLLHRLAPGVLIWQQYDPTVKTDLFSSALKLAHSWLLIDPIGEELENTELQANVAAIAVTNRNHWRATPRLTQSCGVPVFCHRDALEHHVANENVRHLHQADPLLGEIQVIELEGAAPGEVALLHHATRLLVLGDALINIEPYGFTLLPAKYCDNQPLLKKSLRQLLDCDFDKILFGHGLPLLKDARGQLHQLLDGGAS